MKVWTGDPSFETLGRRTGVATSTVFDAFNPQRRRMPSLDLVRAIAIACGADASQTAIWESAWRLLRERIDSVTPSVPSPSGPRSEPIENPGPTRRVTGGGPASPSEDAWVPRELPQDVSGFIGRTAALFALAGPAADAPATLITGTAGVGKTALAVHWAHQIAERYPDGQLYLDLRGHSADAATTPAEALSLFLQSLGVPGERIPVELPQLIGLYRSVLARRRVLVVLDNVMDVAHVRPLLPSGPQCHALITSRDALTGLLVRERATQITLNTLTTTESAQLLAVHLGVDRVAAEPEAAADLAELCAHLPLALRIAAANLATRPNQSIAGAVGELQGPDLLGRLQVVGDPESAVAATFDLSYRSLPRQAQQLFRLLGLVPGPEVDRAATAILLGRPSGDQMPELDELLAAHLIFEASPGRYRTHDLLALYARRHAGDEPALVREEVLHRLLSWYVLSTDAAVGGFTSISLDHHSDLALVGTAPAFSGAEEAASWLRAELPNLIKAVIHAADHGPAAFAWHLAYALSSYLFSSGTGVEQLTIARAGLRAAEAADHALARAQGHMSIGAAAIKLDELRTAMDEFERAQQQYLRIGNTLGILTALDNLGDVCLRYGDIDRAVRHFEEALQISTTIDPSNAAVERGAMDVVINMCNRAIAHRIRGNHAEALELYTDFLTGAEQTGSRPWAALVNPGLGMTYLALGDLAAAEPLLLEAHSAAVERVSDLEMYDTLAGLVLVCARSGRIGDAFALITPLDGLIERAVPSYTGDDWGHAAILETYLAAGRLDEAIIIGDAALEDHERSGHRLTAMRVRILLGRIHAGQGNDEDACRHWESALVYAIEQALPDRAVIEGLLADISPK